MQRHDKGPVLDLKDFEDDGLAHIRKTINDPEWDGAWASEFCFALLGMLDEERNISDIVERYAKHIAALCVERDAWMRRAQNEMHAAQEWGERAEAAETLLEDTEKERKHWLRRATELTETLEKLRTRDTQDIEEPFKAVNWVDGVGLCASQELRQGNAYVVGKTWNLYIGKLHRVWLSHNAAGIENESATLWGWDWWWQY